MGRFFSDERNLADFIEQEMLNPWINDKFTGIVLAHKQTWELDRIVLWVVVEITATQPFELMPDRHLAIGQKFRFIRCHLLEQNARFGWGYKPMDESAGPCYYSCPLQFLDMAPEVLDAAWRQQVRRRHTAFGRDSRSALA